MAAYVRAANTPGAPLPKAPDIAQKQIRANRAIIAARKATATPAQKTQAIALAREAAEVTPNLPPNFVDKVVVPAINKPTTGGGGGGTTTPPSGPDPFGTYLRKNPNAATDWNYLKALMDDYGLGGLTGFIKEQLIAGRSQPEILQRLREHSVYKTRFKAIEERKAKGLAPISEGDVVNWERQATAVMRRHNIAPGFYDSPEDFAKFIAADWSVNELNDVVTEVSVTASEVLNDPENASRFDQYQRLYGVKPTIGDLTTYLLDPQASIPALKRKVAAVGAGTAASRSGFGQLTTSEAEYVGGFGVTDDQAAQAFGNLTGMSELFTPLTAAEDQIGRDVQLKAAFGQDANAKRKVEKRAEERVATFGGGGGFATNREGYAGLGRTKR